MVVKQDLNIGGHFFIEIPSLRIYIYITDIVSYTTSILQLIHFIARMHIVIII